MKKSLFSLLCLVLALSSCCKQEAETVYYCMAQALKQEGSSSYFFLTDTGQKYAIASSQASTSFTDSARYAIYYGHSQTTLEGYDKCIDLKYTLRANMASCAHVATRAEMTAIGNDESGIQLLPNQPNCCDKYLSLFLIFNASDATVHEFTVVYTDEDNPDAASEDVVLNLCHKRNEAEWGWERRGWFSFDLKEIKDLLSTKKTIKLLVPTVTQGVVTVSIPVDSPLGVSQVYEE